MMRVTVRGYPRLLDYEMEGRIRLFLGPSKLIGSWVTPLPVVDYSRAITPTGLFSEDLSKKCLT